MCYAGLKCTLGFECFIDEKQIYLHKTLSGEGGGEGRGGRGEGEGRKRGGRMEEEGRGTRGRGEEEGRKRGEEGEGEGRGDSLGFQCSLLLLNGVIICVIPPKGVKSLLSGLGKLWA